MNWFPLQQLHNAKLALAFSDPAGAHACLAIAKMVQQGGDDVPPLFTNRQPKTAFNFSFPVVLTAEAPDYRGLCIDTLFTGTSHPHSSEGFENRCILKAKEENVYTISFIDHWVNFKLRFSTLPEDVYPDEIWVVNEEARRLAIEEGLPVEKIKITGNPYHFYLKEYWTSSYSKGQYLVKLGITSASPVILYAPDPVALRPGKEAIGFSEAEVLGDLLQILNSIPSKPCLLIKLHPLQPKEEIEKLVKQESYTNCFIVKEVNIPELIKESDMVIGFYSNLLLEAAALETKVIRYFPGDPKYDLLNYSTIGQMISNKAALENCLHKLIAAI